MTSILLTLQIFIVIGLICIILVQRTGNDGVSGLAGGGHNLISSKAANSFLSKLTIWLAIAFMANSLLLAKVAILNKKSTKSLIESVNEIAPLALPIEKPVEAPIAK